MLTLEKKNLGMVDMGKKQTNKKIYSYKETPYCGG